MSRHLDGSPKPVDPLWYRKSMFLRVLCSCGHQNSIPIMDLIRQQRLDPDMRLYQLIPRAPLRNSV